MTVFNIETLVSLWEDFFRDADMRDDIWSISDSYPEVRSLYLQYSQVARFDTELAEYLIEKPRKTLYSAEVAARNIMPADAKVPVHVRVTGLPPKPLARIDIRNLRKEHLGKLVAIEGLVKKATDVRPKVAEAAFMCRKCGNVFLIEQEDALLREPLECPKDQGGCGERPPRTKFDLLKEDSYFELELRGIPSDAQTRYVDMQKIEIQEIPEGLRGGDQPQRLECYLEDDVTGMVFPGDRVVVNGILRTRERKLSGVKSTYFQIFLDVNSIEMETQEFEEMDITPEDEEKILKLSKEPDIHKKIARSIAPTIYGLEIEKDALALQLFGGVSKVMPDDTHIRGDIHILLIGDPGTAKSQLLRYISNLAPRGIYASGKAATAAGLTAAATKDEFGGWTLEAGALVLADKGIACIDELDKMSSQDRSSMHEAMEQQRISIAKAGITATLNARCAILAAANPKLGRFDEHDYLVNQINLPPSLISRFDVILSFIDKPDKDRDRGMARHIINVHRAGEIKAHREMYKSEKYTYEDEREAEKDIVPPVDPETLKKYIAYAHSRVFPVLSDEAAKILEDYYVDIRNQYFSREGIIPMTPRQEEALIRLAEASARLRLSDTVTADDARRAIHIIEYYLRKVAGEEGGGFSIDVITSGTSFSQRERVKFVLKILEDEEPRGLTLDEIIERTSSKGISPEKVRSDIEWLIREGHIYENRGRYRIV